MFYVHLFLEAMYRKMKERRKKTISKTCGRRAEAAESDCILLGRAKKKLQWEINWQHVEEQTGEHL